MEFVEAMKTRKRMCDFFKNTMNGCISCPAGCINNGKQILCSDLIKYHTEEAEEILAKWNAEHPVKTLKDVFNEAFPNAPKHGSRAPEVPAICVSKVGYTPICQSDECCEQNCVECWNQPYEETKE